MLNLVCRDTALREEVHANLARRFGSVLAYSVPEEVNEVLYCFDFAAAAKEGRKDNSTKKEAFAGALQRVNCAVGDREFLDATTEALTRLRIVK